MISVSVASTMAGIVREMVLGNLGKYTDTSDPLYNAVHYWFQKESCNSDELPGPSTGCSTRCCATCIIEGSEECERCEVPHCGKVQALLVRGVPR